VRQRSRGQLGRSQVNVEHTRQPAKPVQGTARRGGRNAVGDSIPRIFEGEKAFVMATGPSLTQEVVDRIYSESGWRYIGISDCYRICPYLDFFYACDNRWWNLHYDKVQEWAACDNGYWCTEQSTKKAHSDLHRIAGSGGKGWSSNQEKIHYGSNSGFQITNIAFLLGIRYMVLVGFNMMVTGDNKKPMTHFFGDHPKGLSRNTSYHSFAAQFDNIKVPPDVKVINATSPSRLNTFPKMSLDDAIADAPKND
jgi:hypothetical protein